VPETELSAPCPNNKQLRLNFGGLSKEAISAMASDTLRAGGWVEAPPPEPKVGDKMPDGTVLAGISPDTNQPMYAMPADASLTMTSNEAKEYAAKLDAHVHKDWRVPTKAELNVLFNNRSSPSTRARAASIFHHGQGTISGAATRRIGASLKHSTPTANQRNRKIAQGTAHPTAPPDSTTNIFY